MTNARRYVLLAALSVLFGGGVAGLAASPALAKPTNDDAAGSSAPHRPLERRAQTELKRVPPLEVDFARRDVSYLTDDDYVVKTRDRVQPFNGVGYFSPPNDALAPLDGSANGQSVGIHWYTSDGGRGLCINSFGSQSAAACDKNFPENSLISYRIGECDRSYHSCRTLAAGWHNWGRFKDIEVSG